MLSIIDLQELVIEESAKTNLEVRAAYDAARDMLDEGFAGASEYEYLLGHIINQYGLKRR